MKLSKCFGCGTDHPCTPEPHTEQQKQLLIDLLNKWGVYLFYYNFCEPSLCDIRSSLAKFDQNAFLELEQYMPALHLLLTESDERVMISEKGRLSWYWEDDSDYGASSGIMDFEYTKEAAGQTWAYSEIVSFLRSLHDFENDDDWDNYTMPAEITDDISLLKYLTDFLTKQP